MPLYDFQCENSHRFERFVAYEERHSQFCECNVISLLVPCAPSLRSGRVSALEEQAAKYGCNILGPNEEISGSAPEFSESERRENIKEAIADIKNGRLPPPPVQIPMEQK